MNEKEKDLKKNEEVEDKQETPNYYTVLPANIRYDKRLKANEKILFSEIAFLSQKAGYCYASNRHLAKLYGVSKVIVSRWVNNLIDLGYLKSEPEYLEDTKYIIRRKLYITNDIDILNKYLIYDKQTYKGDIKQKFKGDIKQKFKDNNTSINNTSINNNIYSRANGKSDNFIVEVVDYLNKKTNKNFKSTTSKTKSLINARRKEGYTLGDFKQVIDIKTKQWQKDSRMNEYLRPETLFGNKFESYLQQTESNKSSDDSFNNFLASIEARTRKAGL